MKHRAPEQLDLLDAPLAAGTHGRAGGNPQSTSSGAGKRTETGFDYFEARRLNTRIANERRQQLSASAGLTLEEAIGFAILVLKRMRASGT